jgi:hypothetical protein
MIYVLFWEYMQGEFNRLEQISTVGYSIKKGENSYKRGSENEWSFFEMSYYIQQKMYSTHNTRILLTCQGLHI